MPIRINLLAEAQAAEEERRKDPVKRALLAAVFVVFLVLLWSSTIQMKVMAAKNNLSSLDARWKSIEKSYQQATESNRQVTEAKKKLASLDRLTRNRFLWGTALNAFQQSLNGVEEVQVVRFKTDQSYLITEEAKPAKADNKAKADAKTENPSPAPEKAKGKGKAPPAPKTSLSTEKISITIDAMDSTRASSGHVKYKETIAQEPFFKSSLQKTNGVLLTSLSAPQVGVGRNPFVMFTLQCFFPEKVRRDE
jgi:hypothetical protein